MIVFLILFEKNEYFSNLVNNYIISFKNLLFSKSNNNGRKFRSGE